MDLYLERAAQSPDGTLTTDDIEELCRDLQVWGRGGMGSWLPCRWRSKTRGLANALMPVASLGMPHPASSGVVLQAGPLMPSLMHHPPSVPDAGGHSSASSDAPEGALPEPSCRA